LVGLAKYAKVPVEVVRAKEDVREVEALSSEELRGLLACSQSLDRDLHSSAVFLAQTGLRFDEFMRAGVSDVSTKRGTKFLSVDGKGRKRRTVPLTSEAYAALKALPERTSYFEKRFRRHLAKVGKQAGISAHVHPHLLRASFISIHLNERGTQAIMLANVVGHSSVDTMLKHYYKADLHTLASIM
jgi:integrase